MVLAATFGQAHQQTRRTGNNRKHNHASPAPGFPHRAAQHGTQGHADEHTGKQQSIKTTTRLGIQFVDQRLVRHQRRLQTQIETYGAQCDQHE